MSYSSLTRAIAETFAVGMFFLVLILQTLNIFFRKVCGLLDKIATTSTIHPNTAARRKSRMSRRLRDLKQA